MQGYIKLYRKLLENPIVCKDSDHLSIWIYLLLNATHKEIPKMFKGEKIMLQPGQLLTGRKSISEQLRVTESKVQRVLKCFESEQQIEQQTSNKNRLISILSWSDYQTSEQQDEPQMNNKRTTTEQQLNTNKNVKNEINKDLYGETVYLTKVEHDKLIKDFGDKETDYWICRLDEWQKDNPKKKKTDHNKTIRNWKRADERKRGEKISGRTPQKLDTVKGSDDHLERVYKDLGLTGTE